MIFLRGYGGKLTASKNYMAYFKWVFKVRTLVSVQTQSKMTKMGFGDGWICTNAKKEQVPEWLGRASLAYRAIFDLK